MGEIFLQFARNAYLCRMKMAQNLRRLLLVWVMLTGMLSAFGQDTTRVSLITCSPGTEIYELYGHTALRCQRGEADYAFNFGAFDFNQPNFAGRFVMGKCDYMVEVIPWSRFLAEYRYFGRQVTEQELNLTQPEAEALLQDLLINLRPENRVYRYNFLTNNCTTRVRDVIEAAVQGEVEYPSEEEYAKGQGLTHRQMLHVFNHVDPWSMEGCDILLAADVDTLLNEREAMCLPLYFERYVEHAMIRSDATKANNVRPLVRQTKILVPKSTQPAPVDEDEPLKTMLLVLGGFVLLAVLERLVHCHFWLVDALLLTAQGIVGLLLLFMMLVSEHPGVHYNWLILLFHPFAFWGAYKVVRAALHKQKTGWHAANFTFLIVFLAFSPWMPQDFGKIIVPLALILLTRPASWLISYGKLDKWTSETKEKPKRKRKKGDAGKE